MGHGSSALKSRALSHREAAKLTVDDYVELHGKIHSPKAAADRLRKTHAEHAELLRGRRQGTRSAYG